MATLKSLACDVPACLSRYESTADKLTHSQIRKLAAEGAEWGVLAPPKGPKLDICPVCMRDIRSLEPDGAPDAD